MTNREYISQIFSEAFDETKTTEELVEDKRYCDFEDDIWDVIEESFRRVFKIDTSSGEPTWLGMELWMGSKVCQKLIDKLEKYRKPQ